MFCSIVHGPMGSYLAEFIASENGCLEAGWYVLIAVSLLLCCTAELSTGLGQAIWSSGHVYLHGHDWLHAMALTYR